ncbi:hypothetical protein X758_14495 [Mesorhizobium sp. LSHC416B00]|nr:hypothetical protein X761_16920 [Mesorhizobium sp. LSHC424B00]ESX72361.1 hypothetical protein X758_14495 [Mesorhizobium sp. LSHC416B00]
MIPLLVWETSDTQQAVLQVLSFLAFIQPLSIYE